MRVLRKLACGAAVVGLATLGALAVSGTAGATTPADCKTVTASMVRPDSAGAWSGDWATDTFDRTAKVCHVAAKAASAVEVQSWTYSVTVSDSGAFTTKGTKSFANHTMKPGVTGSFHGSLGADNLAYSGTFDAPKEWGLWLGKVVDGNKYGTSEWVAHLWSDGYKAGASTWSWTYAVCNETLTNASAGNHGDITGLAKGFGTDRRKPFACLSVSYIDNCNGTTTVVLANATPGADAKLTVSGYAKDNGVVTVAANSKVNVDVKPESGKTTVHLGKFPLSSHIYHKPVCTSPSGPGGSTSPAAPGNTGGTPSLPVTGPNAVIYGGGAAALLAVGTVLFVVARRRRVRFEA